MIRLQVIEVSNTCDETVFYAFHCLLVEVQASAGSIPGMHE